MCQRWQLSILGVLLFSGMWAVLTLLINCNVQRVSYEVEVDQPQQPTVEEEWGPGIPIYLDIVHTPRKVFSVIAVIESQHDLKAYNKAENAAGVAQIRPILVEDVNRILKKKNKEHVPLYTLADRYDYYKSYEMFCIYCQYYFLEGTAEDWARLWCGGPDGPFESCTDAYAALFNSLVRYYNEEGWDKLNPRDKEGQAAAIRDAKARIVISSSF